MMMVGKVYLCALRGFNEARRFFGGAAMLKCGIAEEQGDDRASVGEMLRRWDDCGRLVEVEGSLVGGKQRESRICY